MDLCKLNHCETSRGFVDSSTWVAHVLSAGHGDEGEVGVVPGRVQVSLRPRAHHALHRVPVAGQGRHLATNHSSYDTRDEYCGQLTNHSPPGHNTHPLHQSEESIVAI